MASTINAKTTGVGGIDATGDASGVLALQTVGVTGLTIDASQKVTFANSLTSPTLVTPVLGTPTSGALTNCTFPTLNQNTTGSSASCTGNSATATSLSTIVGSAPSYACRAWVNFNGTGTVAIRASGNVSSITDNGVGDYTVNFTTAMSDANYSINGTTSPSYGLANGNLSIDAQASGLSESAPTTSAFRVVTRQNNDAQYDAKYVNVGVFR